MTFPRILTPLALLTVLFAGSAEARYVFVLPPAGATNPALLGYTDNLTSLGSVPIPGSAFQAYTNIAGDKAIVISQNPNAGVTFISIQNGQFSGLPRTMALTGLAEGSLVQASALSPDGQRLIVVAGAYPGTMFIIDTQSETLLPFGRLAFQKDLRDVAVSPDSKYVYAAGLPSGFFAVDLTTGSVVEKQVSGLTAETNVSVAPNGQVYVTGPYLLAEFEGRPPFDERARTPVLSLPRKLQFSPDGRYALAPNDFLNGSSLALFDLETRTNTSPAGSQVGQIAITAGDNLPRKVDKITVTSNSAAVAFINSLGKMYSLTFPNLTVTDLALPGVGVPAAVSGMAPSNEFPGVRYFFFVSTGNIVKYDLLAQQQANTTPAQPGLIAFAAQANVQAAAKLYGFGGNQTVNPGQTLRPYVVKATDALDHPAHLATVNFTADTGASVSPTSAQTSVEGGALAVAVAPTVSGPFNVRVTAGTASLVLTSNVTGGGGGPGPGPTQPRIVKVSGDGQLLQIYSSFGRPLVVRVEDANGKPIAGKTVTWTASADLTLTGANPSTTDSGTGQTSMTFTPGGAMGFNQTLTYSVTATCDVGSVTFVITAYPFQGGAFSPEPAVSILTPEQGQTVFAQLGVPKKDAVRASITTGTGTVQPIPNVGMTVQTSNIDPTQGPIARCEGTTPLSGADGLVSCTLITEGKIGLTNLLVDIGGLRTFTIRMEVAPGAPTTPVIVRGDGQSGKPGEMLPVGLAARIQDAFGNLLPGTQVKWEVDDPNALTLINTVSVADSQGLVGTQVRLGQIAGKFKVKVTAGGNTAAFNVEVQLVLKGFAKVSGDNQPVVNINSPFPQPLIVVVTDTQDRGVPNVQVNWAIPAGSAVLTAYTTLTGQDGRAQVSVTAGPVSGNITVTASVQGFPTLSYALASKLPGPVLTPNSFVNFATGEPGIAPGNLVLIRGTGLAANVSGVVNADLLLAKLPFQLAGLTVQFVNTLGQGDYAPIYRVANENGQESALVQVPWSITGPTVTAVVSSGGIARVDNVQVRAASPGILEDMVEGRRAAIAIRSDGLLVTPTFPARPGETIRMYAIGLGQTTPQAETNRVGVPGQKITAAAALGLDDGTTLEIESIHLAENLIGVYEVVFKIPLDAVAGVNRRLGLQIVLAPGQTPLYTNETVISIRPD